MSSKSKQKSRNYNNSLSNKNNNNKEIQKDNHENNIKFIKRTLENNTHEVIEDTKIKNITSWRKSETKFLKILIFNILSLGILHIVSLFYPKLYLKLYCNPRPPKECDYYLVEDIYGEFTLCENIHKKSNNYEFDLMNNNISSSSLINLKNKLESYITKTLSYSFKYKSVTYEYDNETNEIIPVYMNLSKMTNKGIINYFSDGLTNENIVKKFKERYGKNEYYINIGITLFYFKKIEKNYFIFIIIMKLFDLASEDYITIITSFIIIIIVIIVEYSVSKRIIYEIYKKEFTLDGEENKIKVKRRYKLSNNSNFYYEINNCDLLPGDIIYLKSNDFVPCDCIILEGECLVNENSLTGNLDIFKKIPLKNNNEQFSYKLNKVNILYHGMKIVKTYSKINEGYISALCINTGPNTYKANLFSNILYMFERKKEYKRMYETLGEERKYIFFLMIFILFISILIGIFYTYYITIYYDFHSEQIVKILLVSLSKVISKSSMPVYFLTNSVIYIVSIIHLKKENNIICFDKSKLLYSSTINTIFFSKTGTLCENNFEINSFHPTYITSYKSNNVSYRTLKAEQHKEINIQLLQYYKDYLYKTQINNQDFDVRHPFRGDIKKLNNFTINKDTSKYTCLFFECLLSCNNIEKIDTEIIGNPIEKEIFTNLRWNIKSYNYNEDKIKDNNIKDNSSFSNQINTNINRNFYDKYLNLIDRSIKDIYPNNYYKITESIKNEFKDNNNSKYYLGQIKNNKNDNKQKNSIFSNISNYIKSNICNTNNRTYKLRIFKRFIKNGTLNSSAIVYNFITKELRFMTKGIPEDIINKCDINTLPNNFENIIYHYRKMGFIIITCASKIISIDEYNDSSSIDDYMHNLTFCGFMTLKNKLKKEVVNSIKDLRQFGCNLIISTGDNVYNTLSVGFESNIIENKNIFSFDKDNKNRIIITKLYNIKNLNEDNKEEKSSKTKDTISLEKYSKQTTKISNSPNTKLKEDLLLYKSNDISKNSNNQNNGYKKEPNSPLRKRGIFKRNNKNSKNLLDWRINKQNEIIDNFPKLHFNFSDVKENNNENKIEHYDNCNKLSKNNSLLKNDKIKSIVENIDMQESSNYKKRSISNEINSHNRYLKKYYYYPKIFEENEDLSDNCIYCVSGKLINFLYKNKEKKQCKNLLEKIHKFTKIFYSMSSLDKSLTIDYYREYPDSCVCTIGESHSDSDAIITSNVGINLKAPKNRNTILCHFYSADSSILSIKNIIREGRAVNENILLLTISCGFYSMILNSYIICCFIRKTEVINFQLDFLELNFFIMSVTAYTVQYDNFKASNPLIQNKRLYNCHYIIQIVGIFIIKFLSIYIQCNYFIGNDYILTKKEVNTIFCSYYFIFCIEQLFSTFFIFNLIFFYRKNPFTNIFFIIFNLIQMFYCVILLTLNNSNFKYDIFNITHFEFIEDIIDSFDDNNKMNCVKYLLLDFVCSLVYSRIIYFIFDRLARRKVNLSLIND